MNVGICGYALCALVASAPPGHEAGDDDETASWPAKVTVLHPREGAAATAVGSLARGARIDDLRLPVDCIAPVNKERLGAKHVLFGAVLPAKSDMTIAVVPRARDTGAAAMTVYAYALPIDVVALPNDAAAVTTCKSSTRATAPNGDYSLRLTGGPAPQNVIIGVTAAVEVIDAAFTILVDVKD